MKKLHIISFDIPYPANYGGVIDVYFKLKALSELGVEITLHCFQYDGKKQSDELALICKNVYYYKRKKYLINALGGLPYIVNSRANSELLNNLLKDDSPILFEGLHSTFYINKPKLKNRKKIVRTHNIEHDYYTNLADVESNIFKKYFLKVESKKLEKYEKIVSNADLILAISPNDKLHFDKKFQNVFYLPAFHPNTSVSSEIGKDDFAFYHGKLSVGENDQAAKYLIQEVFSNCNHKLIIAGNNPSATLIKLVSQNKNVELINNVTTLEISDLIKRAHINILPTFQSTGIKLKLINALYQGRFVIANNTMVKNTGLESLCSIANTKDEYLNLLNELFTQEFSFDEIEKRKKSLTENFDTKTNALKLNNLLFE